jgi:hypothetical protein
MKISSQLIDGFNDTVRRGGASRVIVMVFASG